MSRGPAKRASRTKPKRRSLITRLYHGLSHDMVKWSMLVSLALLACVLSFSRSCSPHILADLQSGSFHFKVPVDVPDQANVDLVLNGLNLTRISVDGASSWSFDEASGTTEDGKLELPPVSSGRPQDGPFHAVHAISVPAGSDVSVRLAESDIMFTVVPDPARAGSTSSIRLIAAAGSELTGSFDPRKIADGATIEVSGSPGQQLRVSCRLASSTVGRRTIGLQGVHTSRIRVSEPQTPGARFGVSELLGGTIAFPEIPRREVERLWVGERIEGQSFAGTIMLVEYVPSDRENLTAEFVDPHLRIVWQGDVTGLKIGHPLGLRAISPSVLSSLIGGRGIADYIALATALVAFTALLLPRGEESLEEGKVAVQETHELKVSSHHEEQ